MVMDKGILGSAIKNSRIEKALTQEQLAEMVNITPTHLKQLESERRKPSLEVLYNLARILNFSVDDIFFPEKEEGHELRRKVERNLRKCSQHELRIISTIIDVMLKKEEN